MCLYQEVSLAVLGHTTLKTSLFLRVSKGLSTSPMSVTESASITFLFSSKGGKKWMNWLFRDEFEFFIFFSCCKSVLDKKMKIKNPSCFWPPGTRIRGWCSPLSSQVHLMIIFQLWNQEQVTTGGNVNAFCSVCAHAPPDFLSSYRVSSVQVTFSTCMDS